MVSAMRSAYYLSVTVCLLLALEALAREEQKPSFDKERFELQFDERLQLHELEKILKPLEGSTSIEQPRGGLGPLRVFSQLKSVLDRCLQEASKTVRKFIKSKVEYVNVVNRYHKWYQRYKSLYETYGEDNADYLTPRDLLLIRFTEIDRELYEELHLTASIRAEAERAERVASGKGPGREVDLRDAIETSDYIFEALKRLIERLEEGLERIEAQEEKRLPSAADFHFDSQSARTQGGGKLSDDLKATEEFKEAMERVKRIALNTAQGVVMTELQQISQLAALNAAARYFDANPPTPGSSLAYIAPIVCMLGSANSRLIVSYLTNIQIRTALSIMDGLNPVSNMVANTFALIKSG